MHFSRVQKYMRIKMSDDSHRMTFSRYIDKARREIEYLVVVAEVFEQI